MKNRSKSGKRKSKWEGERERFFEDRGMRAEEIERRKEIEEDCYKGLEDKDKEKQRKIRRKKNGGDKI